MDDLKYEIPSIADKGKMSESAILTKGERSCQFGQYFSLLIPLSFAVFSGEVGLSSSLAWTNVGAIFNCRGVNPGYLATN